MHHFSSSADLVVISGKFLLDSCASKDMIAIPGVDPLVMWISFLVLVVIMLWIDLGAFNKKDHVITIKESLLWTAFWISLSLLFNVWLYFQFGSEIALEYFTGYVIEKSLSMDNLFVFLMIFTAFSIDRKYQHRILFWGIVGAVVMRGIFIGLGSALVQEFQWIFLLFAGAVLYGAYHMQFHKDRKFDPKKSKVVRLSKKIFPVTDETKGHDFFIRKKGGKLFGLIPFPWYATIFFITLITIEFTDVVFATDSIPAIFAITTDPFLVFTSNIFAILGLRALYFAIAGLHAMFAYLKTGLALILAFVGVKMLLLGVPATLEALEEATGIGMPHLPHYHIPIGVSLAFILTVLFASIIVSIAARKGWMGESRVEQVDGEVRVDVRRKKD